MRNGNTPKKRVWKFWISRRIVRKGKSTYHCVMDEGVAGGMKLWRRFRRRHGPKKYSPLPLFSTFFPKFIP